MYCQEVTLHKIHKCFFSEDCLKVFVFILQVYMLSWFERKAAATFFGEPPIATVDEALDHFMEVNMLKI